VEVVIDFFDLSQIFILHLSSGNALLASGCFAWEQYLVDYNVVNVDFHLCELDSQSLSFVHTKEFWDHDSNEGSPGVVLELHVNLLNFLLVVIQLLEHLLLHIGLVLLSTLSHHCLHLVDHASELLSELHNL
jgi:hypothetical protein